MALFLDRCRGATLPHVRGGADPVAGRPVRSIRRGNAQDALRDVVARHRRRPSLPQVQLRGSLAQTHSLRIRQSSLLTGNGMVAPGCRHASLVPSLPFARRISASVQYRGNLVVTVTSSHTANDIQRLHRRGGFRCGTRPLHRNLRMHTSLPVNHKLKGLVILVIILGSAHDDLFDGGAEDHLLECRRTVVTLPDFSKAITHRAYSDFLFN